MYRLIEPVYNLFELHTNCLHNSNMCVYLTKQTCNKKSCCRYEVLAQGTVALRRSYVSEQGLDRSCGS